MLEWRTVPSSSAMMDSVTCVVTHVLRSCRSHARVTSCTDLTPSVWPSHRWHRPCLVQRSGGWRLTFTTKMVGTKILFHACDSHICVSVNLVNVCLLWSAGSIGIISLFTKKQTEKKCWLWFVEISFGFCFCLYDGVHYFINKKIGFSQVAFVEHLA